MGGTVGEVGDQGMDQGITRRDLLRRGAVLGGAVIWATPVVQTLGMGRAFAQTASPTGKDISYMVISWTCGEDKLHTKLNKNGASEAGATPDCEMTLDGSVAANLPAWVSVGAANGSCVSVTVDSSLLTAGCTIGRILLKAGSDESTGGNACQSLNLQDGAHTYCTV
ncbi:MAG TPA: hypothetical protein VJ950_09340 [Acidimicrobiia bacterium]|nr:hypothetical protein [Acidimicrobiia bacterium]